MALLLCALGMQEGLATASPRPSVLIGAVTALERTTECNAQLNLPPMPHSFAFQSILRKVNVAKSINAFECRQFACVCAFVNAICCDASNCVMSYLFFRFCIYLYVNSSLSSDVRIPCLIS